MPRALIVEARFYTEISALLARGAMAALDKAGWSSARVEVPGALEIPVAIAIAADRGDYDGYVALGCVIRGETSHYDIVAQESARGLQQLALERRLAIGNGILTVDNREQALRRADPAEKNKGADAVNAMLAVAALKNSFEALG